MGFGSNLPAAELDLHPELVRKLLVDQHPDLAELPLRELSRGWDNTMFRLGTELTVRLPHRALAVELLVAEQRWLPEVANGLPLPIPVPVRVGVPTSYYPWPWSVLQWFEGSPVGPTPDLDGPRAAEDLGRFLATLHTPAPADAPVNTGRGVPLGERHEMTLDRIERLEAETSPFTAAQCAELRRRWERYVALPDWDGPPMWLHADLHPMNLLCEDRRISAVIDFGDITSGDPATDLAIGYSLFGDQDLALFRAAADSAVRPIDDAMWERAEGWAMSVGLAVLNSSADSPVMFQVGRAMIGC